MWTCREVGLMISAMVFTGAATLGQSGAPQPSTQAKPATPAAAQPAGQPGAAVSAAPAADKPAFKPEELEQMLAPVALYPDSLLSQVFMASTYPVEVVEAERWMKANEKLKGDALAVELEKQTWDASVRSLVNFPPVLTMMSENISTTVKIGDAFIGQPKEVMDTVQKLRAKAKETGNLKSTEQQKVVTEKTGGTEVIVIESSSPDVIYVPQYNPSVVYGTWPYPSYPPYPYYPPGYVASNVVSFGVGIACGVAWGYALGNCNWGGGNVDIDVNRNVNRNTNIDRSKLQNTQRGSFKHDPAHRQGAAYRNQSSAQRVGASNTSARTSQARNEYRGKAEAGRSDLSRGGADSFKSGTPTNRAGQTPSNRAGQTPANRAGTSNRSSAMSGAGSSGSSTRQASSRGSSSRSSSPSSASRSSSSRSSGASRSSGGSRGGGGGRGGGGRR